MSDAAAATAAAPLLQPTHAYLGALQDVDHAAHSLFPEGAIVKLPLIFLPDIVLFPGDELPLRMLSPVSVDTIRAHLSGDGAVLAVLCASQQGRFAYGTTVRLEKFSVDDHAAAVTGVAKQRFRVVDARRGLARLADVEILPHPSAPRLPFVTSHLRALPEVSSDGLATPPRRVALRRLADRQFVGFWGRRAYTLYDVQRLVQRIQRTFASSAQWNWFCKATSSPQFVAQQQQQQQQQQQRANGSMLRFLTEPSERLDPGVFAYWVAGNLPLERHERLALLQMDCIARLLRAEIAILRQCGDNVYCATCGAFLAHTSDIFSMTSHGAAGTFVNPGGNVFQILTLREVHLDHVVVDVVRSTQDSWFPGYAWSISYCNTCYRHLGWQFDVAAADAGLSPARFFGFRRAALTQSAQSMPSHHRGSDSDWSDALSEELSVDAEGEAGADLDGEEDDEVVMEVAVMHERNSSEQVELSGAELQPWTPRFDAERDALD